MTVDPFSGAKAIIAPSILAANFGILAAEINDVMAGGADIVHLDVMDGHFVPNISFGPPVIKSVRMATRAYLDAHLMVSDPLTYGTVLIKQCGVQLVSFHIEVAPGKAGVEIARAFRKLGAHVGLVINPPTAVETLYPVLDEVDMVLVMSVMPGFGGQKFQKEVLARIEPIKKRMHKGQRVEIDGGIDAETITQAYDAGADWFVVGNALFGKVDRARAIAELHAGVASAGQRRMEVDFR